MEKVSNNKKVIAVVVTYNRKELLKECVLALLNQDYKNCDILIIDNASTDGTKEFISEELNNERVHYMNTGSNLGGAGGFNYGIKEAYKLGTDFIWIMDDDCIVHNDSLTKLIEADEKLNGDYGFLSSKVLWKDDSICKMNIQKINFNKKIQDWDRNYQSIIMATFVSFFIKKDIVEEFGFPIKEFFIWSDDLEYSRRISRKYKSYYISDSVVTHKSKNNIGSDISKDRGDILKRYSYAYRNEYYVYRREGLYGRLYYLIKIMYHKYKINNSDDSKELKKIKRDIIDNAIKEGKKFYPEIEYVKNNGKKILYMYGEWLNLGGQETFTLNVLDNIKNNITIDLFTPYSSNYKPIQESIGKVNGKIYAYNGEFVNDRGNKKDFLKNTEDFLKKNAYKYDIVHIHSGSSFALAHGAKLAKKCGIKKVIVHSHSTGVNNFKNGIIKFIFSFYYKKYVDFYCACSEVALYWKFSKWLIKDNNHMIIKNGIEIDNYIYNENIREEYRKKLNLNNKFVITNVARLNQYKNQMFLIEMFNYVHKKDETSVLLLVGEGPDRKILENKISELGLEDSIILLGSRDDANAILQASDLFVFPSIFEGLGISAIESQASGLVTICSDKIPKEVFITDLCISCDLSKGYIFWADEVLKYRKYERKNMQKEIEKSGYSVQNMVDSLKELY